MEKVLHYKAPILATLQTIPVVHVQNYITLTEDGPADKFWLTAARKHWRQLDAELDEEQELKFLREFVLHYLHHRVISQVCGKGWIVEPEPVQATDQNTEAFHTPRPA